MTRLFLALGLVLEVASVVATGISAWAMQRAAEEEARVRFENRVDRGMDEVRARLDHYQGALHAGIGLYRASKSVEREEWRRFAHAMDLERQYPAFKGFGYIARVPAGELDAFVARERADGAPDFTVHVLDQPPPGDRYLIRHLEPQERNRRALGLDIGSEAQRRAAADAAGARNEAQITSVITLNRDQLPKPGFLMLVPFYATDEVPADPEQRRAALRGWAYAPIISERVLAGVVPPEDEVAFSLYDGPGDRQLIYDGLIGTDAAALNVVRDLAFGGRQWSFLWRDTAAVTPISGLSLLVLAIGLGTSTGILVMMWLLHRSSVRALATATQAVRVKADFLAVMSHEIRTPLNGVIGMAEILLRESLPPAAAEQVAVIRSSGRDLLALVNDILDVTRMERGNLELEMRPCDLAAEISGVAPIFAEAADRAKTRISVRVPTTPAWVMGDALRIRQIALNLVGNAVKFSAGGRVDISLERDGDIWVLTVADTGIGMSPETLTTLFSPFTQADASTSRRFGGSGLGLSIVKRLVDRMQGTVRVESEPGRGSRFIVRLPLPPASPPTAPPIELRPMKALDLDVLLVEDNPINQTVAKAMLARLGCRVRTAGNGAEAIAIALAEPPDVILMDCQMPTMDGLEATRRLRQAGCTVPVIALTANVDASDRSACTTAGMQGFLGKPLLLHDLRTGLEGLPRRR